MYVCSTNRRLKDKLKIWKFWDRDEWNVGFGLIVLFIDSNTIYTVLEYIEESESFFKEIVLGNIFIGFVSESWRRTNFQPRKTNVTYTPFKTTTRDLPLWFSKD